MKNEDRQFIKELQHEMNTQSTCYQANPRFWVVAQEEITYGLAEEYADFSIYTDDGGETICTDENPDEIKSYIIEHMMYDDDYESEVEYKEAVDEIKTKDIEDLVEEYDIQIIYGSKNQVIKSDTFFLTLRECKEHIKRNSHHYNKTAHPWAMTAWRSPQVERLYEVLQKTNWNEV